MKCYICTKKGAFTCPCKFVPMCSDHLEEHIYHPGKHSCEILNITLTDSDSKILRKKIISRIQTLERSKSSLLSQSDRLIKLIENCTKIAFQEFDCHSQLYSSLLTFSSFSTSLKLEVDKILSTDMKIKAVSVDITKILNESYTQGLVTFVKNEIKEEEKSPILAKKKDDITAIHCEKTQARKTYNSVPPPINPLLPIKNSVPKPNIPEIIKQNPGNPPSIKNNSIQNTENKSYQNPSKELKLNQIPIFEGIQLEMPYPEDKFASVPLFDNHYTRGINLATINPDLPVRNIPLQIIENDLEGEVEYEYNEKNMWPLKKKLNFMTSLNIKNFNSQLKDFEGQIKEILFTNDGKFSYICKKYAGRNKQKIF